MVIFCFDITPNHVLLLLIWKKKKKIPMLLQYSHGLEDRYNSMYTVYSSVSVYQYPIAIWVSILVEHSIPVLEYVLEYVHVYPTCSKSGVAYPLLQYSGMCSRDWVPKKVP